MPQQKQPSHRHPQTGEVDSFETFYREKFRVVVGLLLRLGAGLPEAEDAVQSAMLTLMSKWDDVQEPAPWVRVVAKNIWLRSMNRARTAVPGGSASDVADAVPSDGTHDPAQQHFFKLEQRETVQLLRSLPLAQQSVLALTVDGLQPSEIAELLGKPATVVRSNLSHARRRLRESVLDPRPSNAVGRSSWTRRSDRSLCLEREAAGPLKVGRAAPRLVSVGSTASTDALEGVMKAPNRKRVVRHVTSHGSR